MKNINTVEKHGTNIEDLTNKFSGRYVMANIKCLVLYILSKVTYIF